MIWGFRDSYGSEYAWQSLRLALESLIALGLDVGQPIERTYGHQENNSSQLEGCVLFINAATIQRSIMVQKTISVNAVRPVIRNPGEFQTEAC